MQNGVQYFSNVRACSSCGVCVNASSDGITIDSMPPYAGTVQDGYRDQDIDFHLSRCVQACVCVCVCVRTCVRVCHNEKKVPDECQAQQAIHATLHLKENCTPKSKALI